MKNRLPLLFLILSISLSCFAANEPTNKPLANNSADIKMLSTFLIAANGNMADGNRVVFDAQYSNQVDGNDAVKLTNPGENFGLLRDNTILTVEARQPIANGDTLFYDMTHLLPQTYKLEIDPEHLSTPGIVCELVDRYLNTRTNISLTDSNHFTVNISTDPASKAVNRFIVVFSNEASALPFTFNGITAINNDNRSVTINWQVNQELNVAHYELERSIDNIDFKQISSSSPFYNDQDGGNYQYNDLSPFNTDNFYRVKEVSKNGGLVYSDAVKITVKAPGIAMSLYPNPVINHSFQVKLNNLSPGRYLIKLTNNSGQQVYSSYLNIMNNNFTQAISLDANIGKGNYHVTVMSENGIVGTEQLIVP